MISMSKRIEIMSKVNEMFPEGRYEGFNSKDYYSKPLTISDSSYCIAIFPRSNFAKEILKDFSCNLKFGVLDHSKFTHYGSDGVREGSKFSIDYLDYAMSFFKMLDDNPVLICGNNVPIKMIGKDFGFVIAPRVESR